jgi:hypothetical protein
LNRRVPSMSQKRKLSSVAKQPSPANSGELLHTLETLAADHEKPNLLELLQKIKDGEEFFVGKFRGGSVINQKLTRPVCVFC